MRPFICKRRNGLVLAMLTITLGGVLIVSLGQSERRRAFVEAAAPETGLSAYLNSARQLLSSGEDAREQVRTYSSLMPNENPRTVQMLRDTIGKTSELINDYQHDGLANMPQLPNVPGLNTIMRLPDKLLRAELSMLQDGIRMAEEMRERPITATVNTPRGKC